MNAIARILSHCGPNRTTLAAGATCSVAESVLELAPYGILYLAILECSRPVPDDAALTQLALAALAAILARGALRWAAGVLAHRAGYRTLCAVQQKLAAHLPKLPMLSLSSSTSGAVLKVLDKDVERLEMLLCHHIPDLCAAAATPVLSLCVLFWLDWRLGVSALAPLALAVFCQARMFRECSARMAPFHESMAAMNSVVSEYLSGIMEIKAFNQNVRSFARFSESIGDYEAQAKAWSGTASRYYALFGSVLGTGLLFLLPPGLWLLGRGEFGFADLLLGLMLAVGYAMPLDRLLRFGSKLREVEEGLRRIDELLDRPPLSEAAQPRTPAAHDIEFDGVDFGYRPEAMLFSGLSMRLKAGTCTAFVGPSGAGKTTAALLAGRYQDVLGGAVRIGGVDVRDIATETLMDMICFVFQDTFLFSATVRDNIRVGRPNAGDAQVEEAARQARAHEFILQLPQGYDTPLGEGGLRLSGGERQRLSLARAILKDAPIVILDEATAYADPENEVLLQEGVSRLLAGKTVIVIGHRLSALTGADAICVFEAGRLAGMGRHVELLRHCSLYARMWALQETAASWTVAGEGEFHAQAV